MTAVMAQVVHDDWRQQNMLAFGAFMRQCPNLCGTGTAGYLRVENRGICLMISVKSPEGQPECARLGAVYRWDTIDTVEGCRRLNVLVWQRGGFLRPARRFSWAWWDRDGVQVASITVRVQQGRVFLCYRIWRNDEDWQDTKSLCL
jgi:hypothetical protein